MKPKPTWKSVERNIAKYFPDGQRRGADYRRRYENIGKTDVITSGWAVEIKHSRQPKYGLILDALEQATKSKEHPDDIVVAIIHKYRQPYDKALACMYLPDFVANFGYQEDDNWYTVHYTAPRIEYGEIERLIPMDINGRIPVLKVTKKDHPPIIIMYLGAFASRFINII